MKNLSIILIFLSSLVYPQSFNIKGKLTGFSENTIIKITKDNLVLDSCKLQNGNFFLNGKLQYTPAEIMLQINDGQILKYGLLFIGNEKISINASINDFPFDIKAIGSKYDNKKFELLQKLKPMQKQRDELLKKMFLLREQKKWNDSLQKDYWSREEPLGKIVKIDNEIQKVEYNFINENINSYYALYRLDKIKAKFGNDKIKQNLKKLRPEFKRSFYTQSIINQ